MSYPVCESCSVLNKLTLLKFEIHMEELKKKYTPYTESERMSYIREYLSTSETKYQFAKRTGICRRLLILWLDKYHINDKVMSTEQPSLRKDSDESLNELEKELAALRAENRKLQRALQEESLLHEACEELILRSQPITSRFEKTPMPSNRHLVTGELCPSYARQSAVPL